MKGAGQPRDLDFDPPEDRQTISVFEMNAGKEWLETRMAEKLASQVEIGEQQNRSFSKGVFT